MNINNKLMDNEQIEEEIVYEGNFENISDEENDEEDIASSMSKNNSKNLYLVSVQTEDFKFDRFIEALQEIVIEEQFETLQANFFNQYCEIFEEIEENKLEYYDIFKKYTTNIESFLEKVFMLR